MQVFNKLNRISAKKTRALRGRLIYYFSLFIIPVSILVVSALALLALNNLYPITHGTTLDFQMLEDADASHSPGTALAALRSQEPQLRATAAAPAWLLIGAKPEPAETALSLSASHAQSLSCWNASTLKILGTTSTHQPTGAVKASRQGFAILLDGIETPTWVLCHAAFVDAGPLSVEQWSAADLRQSSNRFVRGISLLEGGLLTITLFIVVIALTNREWIFLLLAAWIVGNLRLGAFAMGWDTQWLGRSIPMEWMPFIRKLTVAAYYLLSYTLFTQLFRNRGVANRPKLLRSVQWAGLALLAGAFILPYKWFEPVMWLASGYGIMVAAFFLVRNIHHTHSRIWMWHIVLLGMAVCLMVSGMAIAIYGRTYFIDIFNGVIVLLLSNVMVALAVAERLREDRRERVRAQTALVSNYAVTPIGMFSLDLNNVFLRANPILEQMLGFSLANNNTARWTDYFEAQDWQHLSTLTHVGREHEIKLKDSAVQPNRPQHFALRVAVSDDCVEGSLQDITERTRSINHLRNMLDRDPLTDVLNRRGIEKELDLALLDLPQGKPCALAYLDLDHFKRINGLFGHTAGDEVLRQVCRRVESSLTDTQKTGRIGGDEFIILFPASRVDSAKEAALKIMDNLHSSAFHFGARVFHVKGAMGVVEISNGMSAKDAISAASHACQEARRRRQDVMVYEHDSQELQEHAEELRLFDALEGSESPRGLYLEVQPIMSLRKPLESLNFEVLLRVKDSNGIQIPTGKFITSAEDNGTITIIDKWVFSATLEWLAKHEQNLSATQFVSINLSGVSLNDDKFIEELFICLAGHASLAHRLYIEITEGVALQDLERTRDFITRMQDMGIRISLDDFGAGYSSFSYLKELRTNAIKIDGALVKDMTKNNTNMAIVRAVVELARNLGMISIAEWVEDSDTLRALNDMGVDYAQGFAISKARPPIDILNASSIADLVSTPGTLAFISEAAQNKA
ncbi:MAG: EAL domain-containing protein [Pusillimonas sp.]